MKDEFRNNNIVEVSYIIIDEIQMSHLVNHLWNILQRYLYLNYKLLYYLSLYEKCFINKPIFV